MTHPLSYKRMNHCVIIYIMRHDARNMLQCNALGCTANVIHCISDARQGPPGLSANFTRPRAGGGGGRPGRRAAYLSIHQPPPNFRPSRPPPAPRLRLPFAILSPAIFCHLRWSDALPAGSGSTSAVDRQPRLSTGRGAGFTAGGWSAAGQRSGAGQTS